MQGVGLLAILAMQFVPDPAKLVVLVVLLCHYLLAVRRVYEESWIRVLPKAALVALLDLIVIALVGSVTSILALML
jgi:hypothetical protein